MNKNACLKNFFQTGIFSHIIFTENKNTYSHLITIMLDKIFKHIHYYYIQPRKGAPPWWLNLLVLLTSLILVCFIWQPIKVFTVSEPIKFSEEKGDSIAVIERSWLSGRSNYTDWMKIKFNKDVYQCNCYFSECTYKSSRSSRYDNEALQETEILLINNKYCLVTKVKTSDDVSEISNPIIKESLGEIGPMQEYSWYRFYLGLFLFFYSISVYGTDRPAQTNDSAN